MKKIKTKGEAFEAVLMDCKNYHKIDDSLKNDVQFNEFIMEHCEKFLFFDFNKSIQNNVNILRIFIRRFNGFNSEYFDELKEWRARYEILELEQEMLKEAQINTNTIRINKF